MALFIKPQGKNNIPLHHPEFLNVRPVLNTQGEERFGVIELAPGCASQIFFEKKSGRNRNTRVLTGGLRLSGSKLDLWLAGEQAESEFWQALTGALPADCAGQFILQRRPGSLGQYYENLREPVQTRLNDDETAYLFLEDYLENLVYPAEDAGLAELRSYILISARTEEELGDRLAMLYATLPCESAPLTAAELETLVAEYGVRCEPQISAEWVEAGDPRAYWTLVAPPPHTEGGWTRPLLEREDLAKASFDIVAHLAPGKPDNTMCLVLQRRQEALLDMLASAEATGVENTRQELAAQLAEVERRLEMLANQEQRFYEVGICIALNAGSEEIEEEADAFELALLSSKLSPRRVVGQNGLELAWGDCAPLNLPHLARLFVMGEQSNSGAGKSFNHAAGRLVQLASFGNIPQEGNNAPLVGYTRGSEAFHLNPGPGATVFLTGEPGNRHHTAARNLVKYLLSMRYLSGQKFCIFDKTGEWREVVKQLNSRHTEATQIRSPHRMLDLLNARPENLQTLEQIGVWVSETAQLLSALLDLEETENLEALLLGAVVALQTEGTPVTPETLWQRAENDGNETLATKLSRLVLDGDLAWLFIHSEDDAAPLQDLMLFGFEADEIEAIPEKARLLMLSRLFAQLAPVLGSYTLVLDGTLSLLADPAAASACMQLVQQERPIWAIFSTCEELVNTDNSTARWFLEHSRTQLFFRQIGPALGSVAKRLDLSARAVKAIRELAAGAAVVRRNDGSKIEVSAFEPLPGTYLSRLAPRRTATLLPGPSTTRQLPPQTEPSLPVSQPEPVRLGA